MNIILICRMKMADNHKLIEEEAPDEIFNDEGQLVASKLETCIFVHCKFHIDPKKPKKLKIQASDVVCSFLGISQRIKSDPRKGNKDVFFCIAHIATPRDAMQGPMLFNFFVCML